jgi:hypothetical protein
MLRRNLLILSLGCVLSSCSTPDHIQRQVIVKGFNFSPYTSKGFLFTPLLPTGDYESIGLVSVSIQPEITKGKEGETAPKGYTGTWYGGKRYWVEDVSPGDVIEEMYKKSIAMGANALTQFTMTTENIRTEEGGLSVTVFKVSGFAVKRK